MNVAVASGTRTADASTRADLVARMNGPGNAWDGGVLDLSALGQDKAAELLETRRP